MSLKQIEHYKEYHTRSAPQSDQDLFNNPMTKAAAEAMTDEDKERYKKIGEEMYGSLNFEGNDKGSIMTNDDCMKDAVRYIEEQLKSGLHISDLNSNECAVMKDAYGEEWYAKWNYTKEDLESIVTTNF